MGIQRKVIPVILALVTPLLSASQCELTDIKPTEPDVQLTAAPISIETGQSTTLSWNSDVSHISLFRRTLAWYSEKWSVLLQSAQGVVAFNYNPLKRLPMSRQHGTQGQNLPTV